MLKREKGSLSIEAGVIVALFLVLLTLFYGFIYGYHLQRLSFEQATLYVLEENDEFIGSDAFEKKLIKHVQVKGDYTFLVFNKLKEQFPYRENGFAHPLEEIVFITDYGKMYHLPGCPTVKKSLRPVIKKDVPHLTPCSVCR